jgi:hypothetical protein
VPTGTSNPKIWAIDVANLVFRLVDPTNQIGKASRLMSVMLTPRTILLCNVCMMCMKSDQKTTIKQKEKNQKNNHYFEMRLVCKQITHHTTDSWTNGVHVRGGSRSLQWN